MLRIFRGGQKPSIAGLAMKKSRTIENIILTSLTLFLLLSGCAKKPVDNAITFSVGGAPAELKFWNRIIDSFEKETGIRVDLVRQPTDTDLRRQGLMTSLKSRKSRPDVFLVDVAWLGQFASSGWLTPLNAYIETAQLDTAAFFPDVMAQADTYRGKFVALPVYVDGGLLYYRTDLLKAHGFDGPPETWRQLLDQARGIQLEVREENPDFYGFAFTGAQYEGLICTWLEFAVSAGGGIGLQGRKLSLNTDENRRAVEFMRDLIHEHKICPPNTYTEMKEEQVRTRFQLGNALFARNWPYAWPLHQADNSLVRGKFDIAALPHFEGGRSISTLGGWHIAVNTYSDRKQDAFRLVQFVTSYGIQKLLAENLGWNPGRVDLYEDPDLVEKMPHLPRLGDIFMNLHARPNVPYYTLISEVLQRRINAVLGGKSTADEALEQAQQECIEIINRYSTD